MDTQSSTSGRSFGVIAVVGIGLGGLIMLYGVLLLSVSLLGGVHVAAIGLTLLLASLFTTEWAGDRWDLSPPARNRLSWGLLVLMALLIVAFVVINFASFDGSGSEIGS